MSWVIVQTLLLVGVGIAAALTPGAWPEGVGISTGIYALIRHPLYAAMMAMGVGRACFWSSGTGLAIAGVFILFLHAKARLEERLLAARFDNYALYASQVPRYLPGWPKTRNDGP